ncbi:hypothetical protein HRbin23_01545 [bacterium HR23]|nr:hypothetical protein HRbin23_01545 [bacterium HR23]
MGAHPPGAGVLGTVALPHRPCPDTPCRTELGDLLKKIVVHIEEETQTRSEVVYLEAPLQALLHIGETVGQGEGQFLHGGGASLPNVITADANGVPARHILRGELNGVHHQTQRGLGGKDILVLGNVFFQDIVLNGAPQPVPGDTPLLGHDQIHGPDDRCRGSDGHGSSHLVYGDAVKENLHIRQGRDRDPTLAELATRPGVIGIVAVEGGHVKGGGEARLPMLKEELEAGVGLLGGAVAGEHAHGPQFGPVTGRVDATGEGILAGQADVAQGVGVPQMQGGIDPLHRQMRKGEVVARLFRGGSGLLAPLLFGLSETLQGIPFGHTASCAWRASPV